MSKARASLEEVPSTMHHTSTGAAALSVTRQILKEEKRSQSSSLRKNVLLLWRLNNSQAAVCKLNE